MILLDAVVIGTGPAGLYLAAELARRGLRVRLLGGHPKPSNRSLFLLPTTLELLRRTGPVDSLLDAGEVLRQLPLPFGRETLNLDLSGLDGLTPYPGLLRVSEHALVSFLETRASAVGVEAETQVELNGFVRGEADVTIQVRSMTGASEVLSTRFLMGCDGPASRVRSGLGIRLDHVAIAETFRMGRVFLVGEAAHVHDPRAGLGTHLSLHDGANLAWKAADVIRDRSRTDLLETYGSERQAIAERWAGTLDTWIRRWSALSGPAARHPVLVAPLFHLAQSSTRLQKTAAGWLLDQSMRLPQNRYIKQELRGADNSFLGGPGAGARAPDGVCFETDSGEPRRLLLRFEGPNHHLLLFTGTSWKGEDGPTWVRIAEHFESQWEGLKAHVILHAENTTAPDPHILVDPSGSLFRAYGVRTDGVYFIRPDGCIAFRSSGASLSPLNGYLQTLWPGVNRQRKHRPFRRTERIIEGRL